MRAFGCRVNRNLRVPARRCGFEIFAKVRIDDGIIRIVGTPLVGALSVELRTGVKTRQSPADRAGTKSNERAGTRPAPTKLGDVVGIFKSISTHQYAINVYANKWRPLFRLDS